MFPQQAWVLLGNQQDLSLLGIASELFTVPTYRRRTVNFAHQEWRVVRIFFTR